LKLTIGLVLALVAAVAINGGFFLQHGASGTLPTLSLRHPFASLRSLFTNMRWLVGYVAGWVGWGIYIVALREAPLSLVQAVAAGGVGVLALAVWRWGHAPLAARERIGVSACVAGLVAVAVSLGQSGRLDVRPGWHSTAVWILLPVIAAGVAVAVPRRLLAPGAGLGAAAGLLFAAGDIATKAALLGVGLLLVPILLATYVLAFVALQLAFQRGTALVTAGVCTLLNNALPIGAGVVLFREQLPPGGLGVLRMVGFAAVVVGAVLLARGEGESKERTTQ
jgi:hypothetical protein